jgi:hypothetical protein
MALAQHPDMAAAEEAALVKLVQRLMVLAIMDTVAMEFKTIIALALTYIMAVVVAEQEEALSALVVLVEVVMERPAQRVGDQEQRIQAAEVVVAVIQVGMVELADQVLLY